MAELIQEDPACSSTTPSSSKPKTSKFLACFGFSRKARPTTSRRSNTKSSPSSIVKKETNYILFHHDPDDHHEGHKIKNIKSSSTSPRWYLMPWPSSRWMLRTNKSATKTVPIDASTTSVTDKRARQSKVKQDNSKTTNSKSKSRMTVKPVSNDSEREVLPATTPVEPPGGTSPSDADAEIVLPPVSDLQNTLTLIPPQTNTIILEHRKELESSQDDTCQTRLMFRRKIDSLRSGGSHSQPGSPVVEDNKKPKSSTTPTPAVEMSHSVSFPTRRQQSRRAPANPSAHNKHSATGPGSWSTTVSNMKPTFKNNYKSKNLDPLVGMSIIMVTLIIMLLWGRLCAILCTSAWFYFLPRFRAATCDESGHYHNSDSNSDMNPRDLDLNSEEYKKKVVLEGLLERNNRNPV